MGRAGIYQEGQQGSRGQAEAASEVPWGMLNMLLFLTTQLSMRRRATMVRHMGTGLHPSPPWPPHLFLQPGKNVTSLPATS